MAKIALNQKIGQSRKAVSSAQKAYQFFVDRGYEHGHDQEDWHRAESIVRNRRS
jgi:hypothetical protein